MFCMRQCLAAAVPAADNDGEEAQYFCRICFEDAKPSELISPCKCKGTLKHVHQACLHRWQANVARLGGRRDERATTCGVCRTRYTSLPPQPALQAWRKAWRATRGLAGAALISLLALCLSGPPLLHLALLLLLLLGTRSQSLLAVLLVVVGGVVASLYVRGLRLVVRGGEHGDMRFSLALIRHGAPVEGLQAGSLLVAHAVQLQGSMFAQAVVLITEKSARGAKGVMLTQPMETVDSRLWGQQQQALLRGAAPGSSSSSSSSASAAILHFLGGPVGLPSRTGPASASVVLHTIAAVPGATILIAAAAAEQEPEQDPEGAQQQDTQAAPDHQQQQQQQQQQQAKRLPAWQQMLRAYSSSGRRQALLRQQVLPAPASAPDSAAGPAATISTLSLYQGGSVDVLLHAVLQANTAAVAAAAATAAAAPAAAAGQGSAMASKLRWRPLHQRGSANRQQPERHANRNLQQQLTSSSSSSSSPGQSDQQQQQQLSQLELSALASSLRMYHGVCVWGAGQLEGEVRAGSWGVAVAELADIIATPPQLLWEQLLGSNRARWY